VAAIEATTMGIDQILIKISGGLSHVAAIWCSKATFFELRCSDDDRPFLFDRPVFARRGRIEVLDFSEFDIALTPRGRASHHRPQEEQPLNNNGQIRFQLLTVKELYVGRNDFAGRGYQTNQTAST
jgi:hypothetical protein